MQMHQPRQVAYNALIAPTRGLPNTPTSEHRGRGVVESPFTFVHGMRTFLAIDSDGVVLDIGLLEPGGDEDGLVRYLWRRVEYAKIVPKLRVVS